MGARFAKSFAERYFDPALGALPKTEVDQLVFNSLVGAGLIDPEGPLFAVTRALNVNPNKAKSLVFQYQLRQPIDDAALEAKVLSYLGHARFSVDEKRLAFGVESPLVRAALQARLKALNIFPDISLSGEILRVPLSELGDFLTSFLSDADVDAIKSQLKKRGDLPKGWLAGQISKGCDKLVEEGGKEAVKAAVPQLINWLASAATTIAPTVVLRIMGV
jgi:hypothetical protein